MSRLDRFILSESWCLTWLKCVQVARLRSEGEKNHKKGRLNCVFENFFLNVLDNCPQVQSL